MKSFLLISVLLFPFTEEEAIQEVWVVLDQQCQALGGWPFKDITNFYQCYSQDGRLLFEERVDPLVRIA